MKTIIPSTKISISENNVLAMIGDQKLPVLQGGVVVSFEAHVISSQDYSPFGVTLSGRSWSAGYRYGFNGMERDDEGMGGGLSTYDYGFRIYNPALGKFLSVDPLFGGYPWYTPYQFAGNRPIMATDLDGLEEHVQINKYNTTGDVTSITIVCVKDIKTNKPMDLELWKNDKFKGAEGKAVAILHLTEDGLSEYAPPTYQDAMTTEQTQILNNFGSTSRIESASASDETWELVVPSAYKDELPSTISKVFDDGTVCRARINLKYEIKVNFEGNTDKIVGDVTKELEPISQLLNGIPSSTVTLTGNAGSNIREAGRLYGKGDAVYNQVGTLNGRPSTVGRIMLARANAVSRLLTNELSVKDPSGDRIKEERGEKFDNPSGRKVDVKVNVDNIGKVEK